MALVEPERSELLRSKQLRDPRLTVGNVYQPAAEALADSSAAVSLSASLHALGIGAERAFLDRRTGRWGTLLPAQPLLPPSGGPIRARAWDAFAGYLEANRTALGIDVAELARPGYVTVQEDGALVQIHAARRIDGIPVRNSYVSAVIRHGNLVLFGTRNWGEARTPSRPSVSLAEATEVLRGHLAPLPLYGVFKKPHLAYVPLAVGADPRRQARGTGLELRLAWVLRPAGELDFWEALVDATTGELLSFEDTRHYAATARQVTGGVYPVSNDGVGADGTEQAGWPMPYADLLVGAETLYTDSGGNLLVCVDATVTTGLQGTYVQMSDQCGALSESTAAATLDLGTSSGVDCDVPAGASAGNTHASRTGYFELNRIREQAASHLPANTWLQGQFTANMNIQSVCNANWDGKNVNFYRSGSGCTNTGEVAGVFDHEWGHGMDDNDAVPTVSNPGEGIADIYASLRLNTSCIGRNFRLGTNCTGYGDPCTACDGVRDIDFAKRLSGAPHDLDWVDANCPSGPAPCGGSVHCEGAVYAEAVWDLWNRDLPTLFSLDVMTARELATTLTFTGAGAVGEWYSCTNGAGGDGCNADGGYLNYLAADDDDGDLLNGTPHMTAIYAAFDRHGIACATPTVQDSGCAGAPTAAPASVTVTALDRGARVSWDAVAGASWYNVYRTDGVHGCDFGKVLAATTSGLEFMDDGLQNGREYSYVVVAGAGGDTCFGPASGCLSVTPIAAAHPSADPFSASLAFANGDGDGFVDNCETVTVTFDVTNLGTALTNPVITSVESTSHPALDASISFVPSLGASLAECDVVQGSFRVTPVGLVHGETLEFRIGISGDELGGLSRFSTVRIGDAESDLQPFASKTFTFESDLEGWEVAEGTFDRTAGTGALGSAFFQASSNGLNRQCDRIRSPKMVLEPTSTLSLWNNYEIEPQSAGTWYDRANVGVVDASGGRSAVVPDGGRLYNADSSGTGNFSGCNDPEQGWADTQATWGESTWSAGALGSAGLAGQGVQLEVVYSTDALLALGGFSFDEVTVTDFSLVVTDAQVDTCGIFADGFESGDVLAWSAQVP